MDSKKDSIDAIAESPLGRRSFLGKARTSSRASSIPTMPSSAPATAAKCVYWACHPAEPSLDLAESTVKIHVQNVLKKRKL
jgi:hypothetical protein